MTDWCILRTSPRATLRLAGTLAKDGFETWTPIETRMVRVPRMNVRRPVKLPIMPGYVFIRSQHLVDMLLLAAMPVKPRRGPGLREPAHADFYVLKCFGNIAYVPEDHLAALRRLQAKLTPAKKAEKAFQIGDRVKVDGGSHGGLRGIVERSDTGKTVVFFNERYTVTVPTCILLQDDVCDGGSAALRAA